MPTQTVLDFLPTVRPRTTRVRFDQTIDLRSGEPGIQITRIDPLYEEMNAFAPTTTADIAASPAAWFGSAIKLVARFAQDSGNTSRPLHVPVPLAALTDPNTVMSATAALSQTGMCAQEICLEVSDASFCNLTVDAGTALRRFREKGFGLVLDVRRSWTTSYTADLRHIIDRIRIASPASFDDDRIAMRLAMAASLDTEIIVDHALWRDAEDLSQLGVRYALALSADA